MKAEHMVDQIPSHFPSRLVATGTLVLLLAGCGQKQEAAHPRQTANLPAASVRVLKVESGPVATEEEVMGTTRARLVSVVEARISGRIEEMPVRLGQKVQAGEVVVKLDAAEMRAREQQADAGLQQAEREWNRVRALFEQQASTRSEYDAAETRFAMAKAALAEARVLLGYVEMKAPFAGVVTRKWADVGDLAAPGKALFELEDPAALQLEVDIPEAISAGIKSGGELMMRVDGRTNALKVAVSEIAPSIDSITRTLRVKFDIGSGTGLRSGQFVRLGVPTGDRESIHVPAAAVVRRGQMEMVFAVADQAARMHLVKTGRRMGGDIEILSGLAGGEMGVVEGAALLMDNQQVNLK